jgi:two-component system phosphate regulon sensor histidine kinase PhoR
MAAANSRSSAPDGLVVRFGSRLSENRWIIAGAAVLLGLLHVAGAVTAVAAGVVLAVLVALIGLIPPVRAVHLLAASDAKAPAVRPDPGLRLFAEALPDPCFICDRRATVFYLNERAAAAFAIREGDALTFRLRVPDLIAAFDRVAKGGPPERVEFVERVPTERWFAAWFARVGSPDGGLGEFVVLILDDMSERRRSERVRVDFVSNASHELRTPLASLAGFIDTLQGPARDDPQARARFLAIMHEQADRMSRLVDDLLSLSRIEMKAHVRPVGNVDLASVVRHVVDSLEPLARELGVTIETKLPTTPVELTGERDELIQVFENLIENACKYGQSGKRVVVTLKAAEDGEGAPRVSVKDFGPGIPEEHLPRLTERFYRVDVEASRRHRGTGLGLAIVKHILARHRARMTVGSRPGEGAEFIVTFPQVPAGRVGKDHADKILKLS